MRTTIRKAAGRYSAAVSATLALGGGLALRLWMLQQFPQISGDTLIYGGLAKNLLLHGQYAITDGSGVLQSTLIRLPGYPLFLALCFRLFGMENYDAVAWAQIALELAGCLLLAGFVRRIASRGAAHCTLWLAALCPFTAVYTAAPLTETLTLFVLALAMWAVARFAERPGWGNALLFTGAVTYAALLRPDGALAAVAFAPALLVRLGRGDGTQQIAETGQVSGEIGGKQAAGAKEEDAEEIATSGEIEGKRPSGAKARVCFQPFAARLKSCPFKAAEPVPIDKSPTGQSKFGMTQFVRMALVCGLLALLPFAVWTARNWRVFHVFEPLAPRYATDPGEDIHPGWQRWVKTWCLDFVSTYDVYWNVPGGPLDLNKLPNRAFDSPAQYAETAALAAAYADNGQDISPDLDARFAQLAEERIAAHPLRYYVVLPLGRLADMWLRPRVENLPIDLDWWIYEHHHVETRFSWFYAGLNALYLLGGIAGLCLRPRFWTSMLAYMVLRSALLTTVEAPEARYTLECFPMLFALGGIALYRFTNVVWASVLKVKASAGSA